MFYLVIFAILVALSAVNILRAGKSGNRLWIGLSALLLIGVAGLRYETGGDWDVYTSLFKHISPPDQLSWSAIQRSHLEIGFYLLCSLVKGLGGGIQTLFFIITSFNITLITIALCRYTKYPVLGLLCYYGILYFNLEMIYIRQAMAVAICFFALQYVESRRIVPFLIWVVIACLFHRVAIVMVPLYFLLHRQMPNWVYLVITGAGAVLMLTGIAWITPVFIKISGWIGEDYLEKALFYTERSVFSVHRLLSIGFMLNLLILACILWFKEQLEKLPFSTIHLNMFFFSLVLYYYCYELVEVSNRFRLFFLISIIALLPMLLEIMSSRVTKLITTCIVVLYVFSFSRGIFLEVPQATAYNPYQNYIVYKLQEKKSTGKARLERSHYYFNKERR